MTNYEKFMCKSVDELAEYIYKNDNNFLDEVCQKSRPCPHGDNVEEYNCINCVKVFLESEVEIPSIKKEKNRSPFSLHSRAYRKKVYEL